MGGFGTVVIALQHMKNSVGFYALASFIIIILGILLYIRIKDLVEHNHNRKK